MRLPLLALIALVVLAPSRDAQTVHLVPGSFPTIQAAIVGAAPGDLILVVAGTYNEALDFLGKAVTVQSCAGAAATIIDRQQQGRCVRFTSGEGPGSVLDGFTITGGRAPNGVQPISGPGQPGGDGGGILCTAAPTIRNCVIYGNRAGDGSNGGFFEPAGDGGRGGGLFLGGPARLANCLIYENDGGLGGTITFPGTPGMGAGVAVAGPLASPISLVNCTIVRNGLANASQVGVFIDGFVGATVNVYLTNTIVRDNSGDELLAPFSTFGVNFCDIQGGHAGVGNIDADPLFASVATDDYRPGPGSPCHGAGYGSAIGLPSIDLDGLPRIAYEGVDIGAYESRDFSASRAIAGTVGLGVGGPFDVLTINGDSGGADRRVQVATNQPFTLAVAQPPTSVAPAAFALYMLLGVPGPPELIDLPFGIGRMAFAPCPLAPNSPIHFTLTDNVANLACPELLPSTAAPWSALAAAGVPFPIQTTVQGVILVGPTSVRVTNGLLLEIQ